jgi:hypothetical protein
VILEAVELRVEDLHLVIRVGQQELADGEQ